MKLQTVSNYETGLTLIRSVREHWMANILSFSVEKPMARIAGDLTFLVRRLSDLNDLEMQIWANGRFASGIPVIYGWYTSLVSFVVSFRGFKAWLSS